MVHFVYFLISSRLNQTRVSDNVVIYIFHIYFLVKWKKNLLYNYAMYSWWFLDKDKFFNRLHFTLELQVLIYKIYSLNFWVSATIHHHAGLIMHVVWYLSAIGLSRIFLWIQKTGRSSILCLHSNEYK